MICWATMRVTYGDKRRSSSPLVACFRMQRLAFERLEAAEFLVGQADLDPPQRAGAVLADFLLREHLAMGMEPGDLLPGTRRDRDGVPPRTLGQHPPEPFE